MLFLLVSSISYAGVNKSGVKPNVLSLPSGPGSIEGLGESFEPQLNSGTATYRLPLMVPPGRNGFAPELALVYNSGNGNGPFGLGWKIDFPYIQRQTDKGQPFYTQWPDGDGIDNDKDGETDEYDEFDTLILSNGEELVPLNDGSWRSENEEDFLRLERQAAGWIAKRKDGVTLCFGTTATSRVQDRDGRIFKWCITEMIDTNGNQIFFSYEKKDSGAQIYCTQIAYNISDSERITILLSYEKRPDIIIDFKPRFELKTAYRCTSIQMLESGQPVRTYRMDYAETGNLQPLSLLAAVTRFGRDCASALPPATFSYGSFAGTSAEAKVISAAPNVDIDNQNIDLIDLNADGLPDILDTNQNPHSYYLNLGQDTDGNIRWSSFTMMTVNILKFLGADTVKLADMDGDGKTDLLDLQGQEVQYYGVDSNLNWDYQRNITSAGFFFSDPSVRLVDANNDKLIDVMQTTSLNYFVWINLKAGKWSGRYTTASADTQLQFNRDTTKMADMNGDRILDLVHLENGVCFYYPGKGYGEYASCVEMNNPPIQVIDSTRLLLTDVNGDGLNDAIHLGDGVRVWLNLGLDPEEHTSGRFAPPFSISTPLLSAFTTFRQADINGNGSTDIVWNTYTGGPLTLAYIDFAGNEQPYQLKSISNGIGRTTTISYRSSVEDMVRDRDADRPWPEGVPFPVPVVAKIEVNDGLSTYATKFEYHDGRYDGEEKEFRGFAGAERQEIGDISAPDLIMAYTYNTGAKQEALKGKPLALKAQTEQGDVFYHEEYNWATRILAEGVNGDDRKVTFPYQETKARDVLEKGNGTPVQLKWEYEYDNYGNMTRQIEHGRMDTGWDDERVTETSYTAGYPSGLSNWILDKVVESTTTDENGDLVAHKRNYYDGSSALGEVGKGNLTRVEEWVAGDEYVVSARNDYDEYGNVIAAYDALYGSEPGHYREFVYDEIYHTFPIQERIHMGSLTLTMSATYDPGWGVMKTSTDFNGFTTHYDYDTFGRLTSITKPPDTGHTVEYDYVLAHELGEGKIINWAETRQRDESSGDGFLHSRTFYDGLGRKIMTRGEGEDPGQIVVTDTVRFNARKEPWEKYLPCFETGTLDFVEPTFNSGFTEHFYDALGREIRINQPVGPEGIVYSTTTYQPLVKTVRDENQTNPASEHFGCGMRYVDDGLLDEDGNGQLREVYEIVKLSDTGETLSTPVEWKTTYSYDLLDNLTGYIDSQNNQKIIEYDGLGRKTFMNDPDRGHMYYTYDAGGNLVKTVDAKEQVIEYSYDGVNRLSAEFYGEGKTEPDVEYHYDVPFGPVDRGYLWQANHAQAIADFILQDEGEFSAEYDLNNDGKVDVADVVKAEHDTGQTNTVTAENALGILSWVRDQSGEEHNSYDERGRVKWVVKRIIDTSPNDPRNFYTAMEYDSMDRVAKLTYLDQTYVNYAYNSRGLLESVPNVIDRFDYNPAGQNAVLELGCGTVTSYDYDHRLRLSRLHTVRSRDALTLQDLNYSFDGVSNIKHIEDGRNDSVLDTIGMELGIESVEARKFNATQSFIYDSLYRLTQASNTFVYGTIDYRYDRISNMIRKNASLNDPDPLMDLGEMASGGDKGSWNRIGRNAGEAPGPHAVTGTEKGPEGARIFIYDNNGNMTLHRGMTHTWDYKDRLAELVNDTKRAKYVYDYTDTRKRKTVANTANGSIGEAFYVDKYSEVREGKLIKYVYEGNNRVARSGTAPLVSSEFQPSYIYLHDHVGSTNLTVDVDAIATEQLVNYPFGHPRGERGTPSQPSTTDYKFTGKERDDESDLQYFEARYLVGHIGRFASVDPLYVEVDSIDKEKFQRFLSNPQEMNFYVYGGNNPLKFMDLNGSQMELVSKTIRTILKAIGTGSTVTTALKPTGYGALAGGLLGSVAGQQLGVAIAVAAPGGPITKGTIIIAGGLAGNYLGGKVGGEIGAMFDPQGAGMVNYGEKSGQETPSMKMERYVEYRNNDIELTNELRKKQQSYVHPEFAKKIEAQRKYNESHPISSNPKKFDENSGHRLWGAAAHD